VIGARHPLIAFNVYLTTDEVGIAKAIAKRIRHSSGGLEFVKALGLLVDGRAQVSMNLTNFRKTSIATVVELIRSEAERHDIQIHSTELVGLIPQEALLEAAQEYLEMDHFEHDQVLETRLHAAEKKKRSHAASFLDQLAAKSATPGGGAAAAYAGAMGASLVAMVTKLSMGKDKYREIESRMKEILQEIESIHTDLENAVREDALAFENVMQAYKLPKETDEGRALRVQAIELAMQGAVDVPLRVARLSAQTNELALELVRKGNLNAISDAGTAGAMASAAVRSAAMNVRINANSLPESEQAKIWLEEITSIEKQTGDTTIAIDSALEERGGI
jgi:glutamate formiminotransferase/formiminotetrahydrofolate cyclodeaminase